MPITFPPPTELPDMHPYRFGDTDEIPAVGGPPVHRQWLRTLGLAALMLVLVAVATAVAFLPTSLITGDGDGGTTVEQVDGPADLDQASPPDATIADSERSTTATISSLDDELPQSWNVAGVTDGLNVRATPGVDGTLIGTLRPDATLIRGTGQRVTVDGREWKQIRFEETVGWVSGGFLVPATGDAEVGG